MSGIHDSGDPAISDVPWALIFDPAVNARALGEIQARGFRAAAGLVDRFVARPGRMGQPAEAGGQQTSQETESPAAAKNPDVEALLQSWRAVLGQLAGSLGGTSAARLPQGAAFDFVTSAAAGHLALRSSGEATTSGEVWLHNSGSADLGDITLRCGDLLSHDGHVIGSNRVMFEPDRIAMPPRCSRGVLVHIDLGPDVPAGRYHTMLLVDGHPDIWLPVVLDVEVCRLMTSIADRDDLIVRVEDRLRGIARLVRNAMLDAMPDGEPHQWLYGPMREYPARPGKALRPALCLSAGRAFGADSEALLGAAVAIELLHNAFLIHDDIVDGSEMRRGRPTLAATYGLGTALNAGDGLAMVAGQVLRRATRKVPPHIADLVWAEFDTMAMRTLEGQATEIGWQNDDVEDLSPEDYLELIMHKTCWYTTIHPLRVGAILGSGGAVELGPMVRFGFHFGAAFQIRDDLLNLIGDEQTYGKEILGDIYEGKRTLTLVHLIATATGTDRDLVRDYLGLARAERSDEMVRTIRALMDDYGSIEFTRQYAEGILLVAEEYFEEAFAAAQPGPDLDFLRALVPYVWARWR